MLELFHYVEIIGGMSRPKTFSDGFVTVKGSIVTNGFLTFDYIFLNNLNLFKTLSLIKSLHIILKLVQFVNNFIGLIMVTDGGILLT